MSSRHCRGIDTAHTACVWSHPPLKGQSTPEGTGSVHWPTGRGGEGRGGEGEVTTDKSNPVHCQPQCLQLGHSATPILSDPKPLQICGGVCDNNDAPLTSGSEKTAGWSCSRTAKQLRATDSFCAFCPLPRCGPAPFIAPTPLSREASMGRCLGWWEGLVGQAIHTTGTFGGMHLTETEMSHHGNRQLQAQHAAYTYVVDWPT